MSELTFSQAERRNFLGPILIALAVLAIAGVGIYLYLPHRVTDLSITHIAVLPTHTVFQTGSRVVGHETETQDVLYVMPTVRIDDKLHVPLFVSDITASLTTSDDTVLTASAITHNDIDNVSMAFPAIKPLLTTPLLRESSIQPGNSAEGMVLFDFPITQDVWNSRKSATVTVEFYHQGSFTIDIPKT